MRKNVANSYENVTVQLDNSEFIRCTFQNCRFVFGGTGPVSMVECEYLGVLREFAGPAQNTLTFLRAMYHGMGEGGPKLVEGTFDEIRKPFGGKRGQVGMALT